MNFNKLGSLILIIAISPFWAGCHMGGQPSASLEAPSSVITTEIPTIAIPTQNPYYSKLSTLTISGICNNGYTVYLSGSELSQQICQNFQYSFVVTKTVDGIYPLMISQAAAGKQASAPAFLFWHRRNSITNPTVDSPATNPFLSGLSTLNLSGGCESGATVTLEGDAIASTACVNSRYDFTVNKFADQIYNITVRQTDPATNTGTLAFVWNKSTLISDPANPEIVVDNTQVFDFQGGAGTYTAVLSENNSGATYNDSTRTYTAGTIAGVIDKLTVTDSLGSTIEVPIETIAATPDHLIVPADSGNAQTHPIGQIAPDPLKIVVADKFNNPVENFEIVFNVMNDGAQLIGPSYRTTNALGEASAQIRLHENSTRVVVLAKPRYGMLPDEAGSGLTTYAFEVYPEFLNSGTIGLNFNVGSNPVKVVSGDFDLDGNSDMAVLNNSENSLGLLKGKGNGLFEAMTRIQPICTGPTDFVSQNLNSLGSLDFVIACSGSDRIAIVLSDVVGTYLPAVYINVDPGETLPVSVVSSDFNKDTFMDIVTLSAGNSVASLRHGDGVGGFSAPQMFAVGMGPASLGILDINKDTYPDIAVLNSATSTLGILRNTTSGAFNAMETFPTGDAPVSVAIGDFNSDLYDDIAVISNTDSEISLFLNDQSNSLHPATTIPTTPSPVGLTTLDLNKDTFLDLMVIGTQESEMTYLSGRGDGTFDVQPAIDVGANPIALDKADFNNDTNLDLVVLSNGNQTADVFMGQGNDQLGLARYAGANAVATASGDLDQDGINDLVVVDAGSNSLSLLKGNNKGLWQALGTLTTNSGPAALILKDVNNDGMTDIIISHQNVPSLRVFINAGLGVFTVVNDYGTGLQPIGLTAADLDGDGYLELVVANSGTNSVSVLRNMGDGNFEARVDFPTGSQPVDVVVADLNADSALDIITVNQGSGEVSVLISNGDLTFQLNTQFSVGNGPNSMVAGYFNADMFIDVAVANEMEGSVSVLLGTGDGSFQNKSDYFCGSIPKSLKMGDFNGDNRQDMIVANSSQNTFTILYGSGAGSFNTTKTVQDNKPVEDLQVGDINGDSQVDIITLEPSTGVLNFWIGN